MLTFLRRIRRSLIESLPARESTAEQAGLPAREALAVQAGGSARRYLLYALGEILLVMIGILLALQVNNWNEEQKQIKDLRSYASALTKDLESDIGMVKRIIKQANRSVMFIDSLANYVRNKELDNLSNVDLYLLSRTGGYRPFSWHRASLDEIKNSGVLRFAKNDSLASMIADYEALTNHLDEDYLQDVSSGMSSEKVWNDLINRNYITPRWELRMVDSIKWVDLDEVAFTDYSNEEAYLKLQQENMQMLTQDISKIYAAVNHSKSVRGGLVTRYSSELPELISKAQAIIAILEDIVAGE